jgi:curved DNA-binding protein CbpA
VEIKKSYKKLALKYHPDKNPHTTPLFQVIQTAKDRLSDPTDRKKEEVSARANASKAPASSAYNQNAYGAYSSKPSYTGYSKPQASNYGDYGSNGNHSSYHSKPRPPGGFHSNPTGHSYNTKASDNYDKYGTGAKKDNPYSKYAYGKSKDAYSSQQQRAEHPNGSKPSHGNYNSGAGSADPYGWERRRKEQERRNAEKIRQAEAERVAAALEKRRRDEAARAEKERIRREGQRAYAAEQEKLRKAAWEKEEAAKRAKEEQAFQPKPPQYVSGREREAAAAAAAAAHRRRRPSSNYNTDDDDDDSSVGSNKSGSEKVRSRSYAYAYNKPFQPSTDANDYGRGKQSQPAQESYTSYSYENPNVKPNYSAAPKKSAAESFKEGQEKAAAEFKQQQAQRRRRAEADARTAFEYLSSDSDSDSERYKGKKGGDQSAKPRAGHQARATPPKPLSFRCVKAQSMPNGEPTVAFAAKLQAEAAKKRFNVPNYFQRKESYAEIELEWIVPSAVSVELAWRQATSSAETKDGGGIWEVASTLIQGGRCRKKNLVEGHTFQFRVRSVVVGTAVTADGMLKSDWTEPLSVRISKPRQPKSEEKSSPAPNEPSKSREAVPEVKPDPLSPDSQRSSKRNDSEADNESSPDAAVGGNYNHKQRQHYRAKSPREGRKSYATKTGQSTSQDSDGKAQRTSQEAKASPLNDSNPDELGSAEIFPEDPSMAPEESKQTDIPDLRFGSGLGLHNARKSWVGSPRDEKGHALPKQQEEPAQLSDEESEKTDSDVGTYESESDDTARAEEVGGDSFPDDFGARSTTEDANEVRLRPSKPVEPYSLPLFFIFSFLRRFWYPIFLCTFDLDPISQLEYASPFNALTLLFC